MEHQDIKAKARHISISAQKTRLVVDLVRGKDVVEALEVLSFNRYDLYIHKIFVDEGPTRKWRRFGARGRVKPRLRRSSHISIILREREEA